MAMRSLKRRFEKEREEADPSTSDYIVFARAIEGQNFTRRTIKKWFYELVPEEEYQGNSHQELLDDLELTSQGGL